MSYHTDMSKHLDPMYGSDPHDGYFDSVNIDTPTTVCESHIGVKFPLFRVWLGPRV